VSTKQEGCRRRGAPCAMLHSPLALLLLLSCLCYLPLLADLVRLFLLLLYKDVMGAFPSNLNKQILAGSSVSTYFNRLQWLVHQPSNPSAAQITAPRSSQTCRH
jgi:hypothetical protein